MNQETSTAQPQRIAVIGGSGFIGTRLVRLLIDGGHDVTIPDIAKSETFPQNWAECDVRDADDLRKALVGVDAIYLLAAAHRDDVRPTSLYYDVNVDGAKRVVEVAAELGIRRIIFTSTVAIYGLPKDELDETAPADPFNDYGHSKIQAEKVLRDWEESDSENRLVVIRPTVVFGEGNRANFYSLAKQVVSKRFFMIGRGDNRKSIAYVENVAAFLAFLLGLEERGRVFNYIDKPDLDVRSLVNLIREETGQKRLSGMGMPYWVGYTLGAGCEFASRLTGRSLPLSRIRVKKFCSNSCFSATLARDAGYQPPFTLEQGVTRTLAHEWPDQSVSASNAS